MVTVKRDRYIAFNIVSKADRIEEAQLKSAIWERYKTLYGIVESSGSGLYFEDYNAIEKQGVIRCIHTVLPQVLSTLAILTRIGSDEVLIHVINVSGTINKAKKSLVTK